MNGWWLVSYIFLWGLVVILSFVALATLRQLGLVFMRLGGSIGARQTPAGPAIGDAAPITRIHDQQGIVRSLLPGPESFKLLLFMSPTCEICDSMIPHIPAFARSVRQDAELLAILSAPDDKNKLAQWRAGRPPVVVDSSLGDLFDLPGLPYGIVINDEGQIASKGTVNDVTQLESLLNDANRPHEIARERVTVTKG
jgi:methylamine dehydrogenase accessory protein MauD